MKLNKLKTGALYEIYDNSFNLERNYGTCIFLDESIKKVQLRTNEEKKEKIYIILNFYSFLRNERFYVFEKDFIRVGSGYLIKKLTI